MLCGLTLVRGHTFFSWENKTNVKATRFIPLGIPKDIPRAFPRDLPWDIPLGSPQGSPEGIPSTILGRFCINSASILVYEMEPVAIQRQHVDQQSS